MSEQDECTCDECVDRPCPYCFEECKQTCDGCKADVSENPCKEMWLEDDKFASLRREPTFKVLSRHEVIMKHREGQVMNRTKGGATVKKIEPERMKGGPEIIKKV